MAGPTEGRQTPPAPVLPAPGELAEDSVGRAAASLVAVVLSALHRGGLLDDKLVDAAEKFSLATGTPLDAIAYVSRLRRHLLRLESVPRELTDDVIDAVLYAVVARSLAELQDQALTDPLTGLGNRRALDRDFEAESARAARTGRPLTVMVIDVDGRKQLNDSRGHSAGDEALRKVASALRGLTRRSDRAYRIGGDEFVALLADADVTEVDMIHQRFRDTGAPTCSIGVASSASDPLDDLLRIADRRLYERRRAMRSSFVRRIHAAARRADRAITFSYTDR